MEVISRLHMTPFALLCLVVIVASPAAAASAVDGLGAATGASAVAAQSVSSVVSGAWNSVTSTVGGWATDAFCGMEKLTRSFDPTPCTAYVINGTCPDGCATQLDKVGAGFMVWQNASIRCCLASAAAWH